MPACDWVKDRTAPENGHVWERGYVKGILVAVRCANCGEQPINVMREDCSLEACRAVFASGAVEPRPGSLGESP